MAGQDCFYLIDGNVDSVPSDLCLCCSRGSSSGGGLNILKAKSNFTLFSSEYIYSHSDFKKIKYCNEFPTHTLT